MRNYKTLLLNANWRPIKVISWRKSIVLVYEGKATEIDFYKNEKIRDGKGRSYTIPSIIVLKEYVSKGYNFPRFTKSNVFIRDENRCQYCGYGVIEGVKLNLDHLHPRSLGGKTSWYNIVVSCFSCNRKKGDRTCKEANMFPVKMPGKPAYNDLYIGINPWKDNFPEEWCVHIPNVVKAKHYVKIEAEPKKEPIYL